MPDVVELRGLAELEDEITLWPEQALAAGEIGMQGALTYLHSQIPQYPPSPGPEAPSPLQTERQRRWFFWALREGRIRVPYVRSGTLGRSVTTDVDVAESEIMGAIGIGRASAPWVVGKDFPGERIRGEQMYQARIHSGRWWQFDQVIERNSEEAGERFVTEFWAEFGRLVGQ